MYKLLRVLVVGSELAAYSHVSPSAANDFFVHSGRACGGVNALRQPYHAGGHLRSDTGDCADATRDIRGELSKTGHRQLDSATREFRAEVGALDWRSSDGPQVSDCNSRFLPESCKVAKSTRGWSGFSAAKRKKLKAMVKSEKQRKQPQQIKGLKAIKVSERRKKREAEKDTL